MESRFHKLEANLHIIDKSKEEGSQEEEKGSAEQNAEMSQPGCGNSGNLPAQSKFSRTGTTTTQMSNVTSKAVTTATQMSKAVTATPSK